METEAGGEQQRNLTLNINQAISNANMFSSREEFSWGKSCISEVQCSESPIAF